MHTGCIYRNLNCLEVIQIREIMFGASKTQFSNIVIASIERLFFLNSKLERNDIFNYCIMNKLILFLLSRH